MQTVWIISEENKRTEEDSTKRMSLDMNGIWFFESDMNKINKEWKTGMITIRYSEKNETDMNRIRHCQ